MLQELLLLVNTKASLNDRLVFTGQPLCNLHTVVVMVKDLANADMTLDSQNSDVNTPHAFTSEVNYCVLIVSVMEKNNCLKE